MLIVSLKYVMVIMRADNNGEGGIMALLALNLRQPGLSNRTKILITALGFIGASLFFGDGIITPAISVLSAVEGLSVAAPAFDKFILPISIGILTALFLVQKHGTAVMGKFFWPNYTALVFVYWCNWVCEYYSKPNDFGFLKSTSGIAIYYHQSVYFIFCDGRCRFDRHRW